MIVRWRNLPWSSPHGNSWWGWMIWGSSIRRMSIISTSPQAFTLVHSICIGNAPLLTKRFFLAISVCSAVLVSASKMRSCREKLRGLGGDGVVRGGEEREPHGLVALEVDLGGLEPGEPAEQVVELPLLDVGGEPRDEDGADLVGAGGSRRRRGGGGGGCGGGVGRAWDARHGGWRRDGGGRRGRARRRRPLLVERVDRSGHRGG
ncbi:Os08g0249300, partial [Oryza sativa Japonica Group]